MTAQPDPRPYAVIAEASLGDGMIAYVATIYSADGTRQTTSSAFDENHLRDRLRILYHVVDVRREEPAPESEPDPAEQMIRELETKLLLCDAEVMIQLADAVDFSRPHRTAAYKDLARATGAVERHPDAFHSAELGHAAAVEDYFTNYSAGEVTGE